MKKTIGILLGVGLTCATHAGITIHGSATGYQNNDKDWLTHTADDIDGNGLGTDGYIFYGDFDGAGGNETYGGVGTAITAINSSLVTDVLPSYVTAATVGADCNNKIGSYPGYEALDNPLIGDGTDGICGQLVVLAGGGGEALDFTISGLAAGETVRVGMVTVLNDDTRARMDIPSIGLTDGTDTLYVTDLPNLSSSEDTTGPGWVFFDIDSDGDYTVLMPDGSAADGFAHTSLGGVTFDTIPEPATLGLVAAFGGAILFIRRRLML
jgi:hypothetical protein